MENLIERNERRKEMIKLIKKYRKREKNKIKKTYVSNSDQQLAAQSSLTL